MLVGIRFLSLSGIAKQRLATERKNWRKSHPVGFFVRLDTKPDGSQDLFKWKCGIPGKKGTDWDGGVYTLTMYFPDDYPAKPPKCVFEPPLWHPNVYPSGTVCLSILNEEKDWKAGLTVPQLLLGIQDLLDDANIKDPAQEEPFKMFRDNKAAYSARVREIAKKYPPP